MAERDRSRAWVFTLNNYNDDHEAQIQNLECKYLVYGHEVAPTTGTPHLQGFVSFHNQKDFNATRKLFPEGTHIEKKKASDFLASAYCKKDGDYFEKGEIPNQGKRSDLDNVREILKTTNKMRMVVEVAQSYQSVKMAEQILKYHETPRTWKPEVFWFYGSTGTGKSKLAYEMLGEDCYTCLSTGRWFDGYDAHEHVLIDDMRKDFMKFHELLRLLDRYAMRVETKGGTRQFLARKIIITSCYRPEDMFSTREDIKQLLRRIDKIYFFSNNIDGTPSIQIQASLPQIEESFESKENL